MFVVQFEFKFVEFEFNLNLFESVWKKKNSFGPVFQPNQQPGPFFLPPLFSFPRGPRRPSKRVPLLPFPAQPAPISLSSAQLTGGAHLSGRLPHPA
jgi:hypothetical protein